MKGSNRKRGRRRGGGRGRGTGEEDGFRLWLFFLFEFSLLGANALLRPDRDARPLIMKKTDEWRKRWSRKPKWNWRNWDENNNHEQSNNMSMSVCFTVVWLIVRFVFPSFLLCSHRCRRRCDPIVWWSSSYARSIDAADPSYMRVTMIVCICYVMLLMLCCLLLLRSSLVNVVCSTMVVATLRACVNRRWFVRHRSIDCWWMDEWIVVAIDRSIVRSIDSAVVLLLLLTYDCIVVTDLIGEDYNN